MSDTNIELHRQVVDAFNARDFAAYTALADPAVEYHSAFRTALAGPAVYHGHAGLRSWFDDIDGVWGDQIRIEPNAYFDLGEHTLALFVLWGRGKSSGAEVTMDLIQVIKWRNDRIVYVKVYSDMAEALRDVGISEEALRPIAP
jgi:ketosteroid isomerase-like protein